MRVTNRMIRKLLPKLISIEKEIAEEKGNFTLFGIFLREEEHRKAWDLVISADWLEARLESERVFIKEIQSRLEREEFLMFAMVLLIEPCQPFVEEMTSEFDVEHGDLEFTDYDFNGMVFERAHIITSKGKGSQQKNLIADRSSEGTIRSGSVPRSYRCAGWGNNRVRVDKLIQKLISIEKEIAKEKGSFTLFGLFLREDQPHQEWDLVISADWLEARLESERVFIKEIQSRLEHKEFLALARIPIYDPSHPFIKEMTSEFDVEHGDLEFTDYDFDGMVFERAHIITSKAQQAVYRKIRREL